MEGEARHLSRRRPRGAGSPGAALPVRLWTVPDSRPRSALAGCHLPAFGRASASAGPFTPPQAGRGGSPGELLGLHGPRMLSCWPSLPWEPARARDCPGGRGCERPRQGSRGAVPGSGGSREVPCTWFISDLSVGGACGLRGWHSLPVCPPGSLGVGVADIHRALRPAPGTPLQVPLSLVPSRAQPHTHKCLLCKPHPQPQGPGSQSPCCPPALTAFRARENSGPGLPYLSERSGVVPPAGAQGNVREQGSHSRALQG